MLALVGSGEFLPPMEAVDRALMARLDGPPNVVCLPTAAGKEGAERLRYWMELGEAHFNRLGAQVRSLPVAIREDAQHSEWVRAVQAANFVYFSGGSPYYLHSVLVGTPLWQAILEVHQRGGVLAGCSAGAMIQGEYMPGWLSMRRAFGLLPGVLVMPHFDELSTWLRTLLRLVFSWRAQIVGIDGNTALLVDGAGWQVLGSGHVLHWRGRSLRTLSAGG